MLTMFNLPDALFCDFTVRCKGCGESIPAPVPLPGKYFTKLTILDISWRQRSVMP